MRAAVALALGLGMCLAADAQSLFKCTGRDGKVVYQDTKCAEDAKQSTVAPPALLPAPRSEPAPDGAPAKAGDAPKDGAGAASQAPEVPMDTVIGILSNYQTCIEDVAGFGAKYDAAFQQWKRRNRNAMARYDQDGPAQRRVREALEIERRNSRSGDADERTAKAERCENNIGPALGPAK